jgi:hypothetical protein
MNIQTFLFNWPNQIQNTKYKIEQLKKIDVKPIIINSDDTYNHITEWYNIGNECYFGKQFEKAIELFDGDVLFQILADASYEEWSRLYTDAEKYFHDVNCGIYAPNANYTGWTPDRSDIEDLYTNDKKVKIVVNTDCICWFIHRDIIDLYKERNLNLGKYKLGWPWDSTLCAISHLNKRYVLRDYGHTVMHPRSTNYNSKEAVNELLDSWKLLPKDIKYAFDLMFNDKYLLKKLYLGIK